MKDPLVHALLFLCIATAIVTLGVFYGDADDGAARRAWPKRMLTFVCGCIVLVVLMLICEHTFGSLG